MGNLMTCVGKSARTGVRWTDRPKVDKDTTDTHEGNSYEAKMWIDDEILAERYRDRMTTVSASRRRSSGRGGAPRVTFRAESFDSRASTESERLNFIMQLIDNLPETNLDLPDEASEIEPHVPDNRVVVAAQVNRSADSCHDLGDGMRVEDLAPLAAAESPEATMTVSNGDVERRSVSTGNKSARKLVSVNAAHPLNGTSPL